MASPERLVSIFQLNCKPFLDLVGWDHPLYRGIESKLPAMGLYRCPVNRKPVNTPGPAHEMLDAWVAQNTGIKFRSNSVFCAGDAYHANGYGIAYVIYPIGDFKFCWSPKINDLYSLVFDNGPRSLGEGDPESLEALRDEVANSGYTTDNLLAAMASRNEIMLNCKNYYMIDVHMYAAIQSIRNKQTAAK